MKSLRYYICKHVGHEDWHTGKRSVSIGDVGDAVSSLLLAILAGLFVAFVVAAIIVFIFQSTWEEKYTVVATIICGFTITGIIIALLEGFSKIRDIEILKCKK